MPDTDDKDVPGYSRPFHTHPHIEAEGRTEGHAHPDGGKPHRHTVVGSPEWQTERAKRLTAARRRALLVLLDAERIGAPVTESNRTADAAGDRPGLGGFVYWQSRAWAERAGYLTVRYQQGRQHLYLTEQGRALAEAVAELTRGQQ